MTLDPTPRAATPIPPLPLPEVKRLMDVALVLALTPLWGPALVCLMLVTRMAQGPGVLFAQTRVGRDGRVFRMWKLRTMITGAEGRLTTLLATDTALAAEWYHSRKLRRDPRVTPWGRILRRYGLDELPQLINVLRGEMSLVGPRPVPVAEFRAQYSGADAAAYLSCRPGISGLWQVSGWTGLCYEDRRALDRAYAARRTLAGDLRILIRTLPAVLAGRGC